MGCGMGVTDYLSTATETAGGTLTLRQLLYLIGAGSTIAAFFAWVLPFIRKVVHVIDDMMGEAEREGVPARPGMLVRMSRVESTSSEALTLARNTAAQQADITHALQELYSNNGSSLRDAVERIETKLDGLLDNDSDGAP